VWPRGKAPGRKSDVHQSDRTPDDAARIATGGSYRAPRSGKVFPVVHVKNQCGGDLNGLLVLLTKIRVASHVQRLLSTGYQGIGP
jgi:hypothetical protein